MKVNIPVYASGACAAGIVTLRVISCANLDTPEPFVLATKVIGAEPISAAHVSAEVSAFPVPNHAVPVYPTVFAGIDNPPEAVSAELCSVTLNELPSRSLTVNL